MRSILMSILAATFRALMVATVGPSRPGRTKPEGASSLIAVDHSNDIGVAVPALLPQPSWICEDHPDASTDGD
jgi:hypothetical protein